MDKEKPYAKNWRVAFKEALEYRFSHIKNSKYFNEKIINRIELFINLNLKKWTDPSEYVLSHVDGMQGMAKFKNSKWLFCGHIDLEDYRFTDPRFVLAGFEVCINYSATSKIPVAFWNAYSKHKKVDGSYRVIKKLFKLLYFMSWIHMIDLNIKNKKISRKMTNRYLNEIKILVEISER